MYHEIKGKDEEDYPMLTEHLAAASAFIDTALRGTSFPYFTSTKVQILVQGELQADTVRIFLALLVQKYKY